MRESYIKEYFMKNYKEFIPSGKKVICIQGMPGIASSGKIAVDYLIKELKTEKLFEIIFYDFPPQVTIDNGLMQLPTISAYYYFNEKNESDIIFLTADFQPLSYNGVNVLSGILVEQLENYKVELIIALGASAVNNPIKDPKVFLSSTSESLLKQLLKSINVELFSEGIITGMNGLLPGIVKDISKIKGVVLLAQACRYLPFDYYSSKKLVEIISDYLKLEINLKELEENIEELEAKLGKLIDEKEEIDKSQQKDKINYIG
jgi:proteasome assembly chaperone (PAC2) family protein